MALTDSSGGIVERYAYDAYGNLSVFDGSGTARTSTAEGNRYTYTGREWDKELHLYHYRARMYDSMAGRFCSRDPIKYLPGPSLYNGYFVPNGIDPMGTDNLWNPFTWGDSGSNSWGEFLNPTEGYQGFGSGYVDNLNPWNGTATPAVDGFDSFLTGGTMFGHGMIVVGTGGAAFVYGTGVGAGVTLTWGGVPTTVGTEALDSGIEYATGVPVILSPADLIQDGTKFACKRLYRGIGPEELDDLIKHGHYGLNPHGSGKYFFETKEDLIKFIDSPDNSHITVLTEVDVPQSFIDQGTPLNVLGEGPSIHFTDDVLLEMYDGMPLPTIIDAPGIPSIGGAAP